MACSSEATARLSEAQQAQSIEEMLRKLDEAEVLTLAHGGYIPLAEPVRWSLVSRRLQGFQPSPRGRHPLNHLLPEHKAGIRCSNIRREASLQGKECGST